ncbi:MAG: DUF3795 domain-containing protein [Candidatus Marinimicrobia bacterium]|nr:DUF3795 domain-containing protein [Candidatus Neomarinimicrobiota bacterium]
MMRKTLIAPCGMNCGICLAFLREKNTCKGCREFDVNKPEYCRKCIIIHCERLKKTASKFCYDCEKYPCKRLRELDKRYRNKYHMSMLDNLEYIRDKGLDAFLEMEGQRRTCPYCGATLCIHRDHCLNCKEAVRT